MKTVDVVRKSADLRRVILGTALRAGKGHIPGAFSSVEILVALYYGCLNVFPVEPRHPNRDRLIFSKGHGCLALYAVLADLGFFPAEELDRFCTDGSLLAGHPDPAIPGAEVVSGSLGHGLGIGCGMALAARRDGGAWRTVVVLGDGELNEGSVWEAAMFAAHHGLSNLTAVVDRNGLSATHYTEEILRLEPLEERWRSFGWQVESVDGHDVAALQSAYRRSALEKSKPTVIIARTVKGKGVGFMQNSPLWHHRMPKAGEIETAKTELGIHGD